MTMTLGMCLGPVIGLQVYQQYGFYVITWSSLVLCLAGAGIASLIRAPRRPVQESVHETPKKVLDRLVLRVGIPLAVNVMIASFSYGVVAVYSALYGKMYGFKYAGLFYALMGLGMLVSRFMVGRQIDRGRVAELSVISLGILTVSFGALAFAPLEWVYSTSAILIGFGFGIFIPTFQTMKLNMADRGHRGAVNSTFFTAFDIGVGTGMFFGGKIYAYLNLNWAFGAGATESAGDRVLLPHFPGPLPEEQAWRGFGLISLLLFPFRSGKNVNHAPGGRPHAQQAGIPGQGNTAGQPVQRRMGDLDESPAQLRLRHAGENRHERPAFQHARRKGKGLRFTLHPQPDAESPRNSVSARHGSRNRSPA